MGSISNDEKRYLYPELRHPKEARSLRLVPFKYASKRASVDQTFQLIKLKTPPFVKLLGANEEHSEVTLGDERWCR